LKQNGIRTQEQEQPTKAVLKAFILPTEYYNGELSSYRSIQIQAEHAAYIEDILVSALD
jgi:hypothetical protein